MPQPQFRDALLKSTDALPNGAATVNGTVIDLQNGPHGDFTAPVEFLLSAPALTTGQQPDAKTLIYSIQTATDAAFTTPIDVYPGILTQTGAGGVGAAAATARGKLPTNVSRYLRAKVVGSALGNSSPVSMTLEIIH